MVRKTKIYKSNFKNFKNYFFLFIYFFFYPRENSRKSVNFVDLWTIFLHFLLRKILCMNSYTIFFILKNRRFDLYKISTDSQNCCTFFDENNLVSTDSQNCCKIFNKIVNVILWGSKPSFDF